MELRIFPLFGSKEIPARNENKRSQMAECVGMSNLELGKFPLVGSEGIPPLKREGWNTDGVCQEVKFGAKESSAI